MVAGFKKWSAIGIGVGAGLAVMLTALVGGYLWYENRPKPWNKEAVSCTFRSADASKAGRQIYLTYAVENHTDRDITISEGDTASLVNLEREKSSYQQDEEIKLALPLFIPSKHSVVAILNLPSYKVPPDVSLDEDGAVERYIVEKFKNFGGFTIFVKPLRLELLFPKPTKPVKSADPNTVKP